MGSIMTGVQTVATRYRVTVHNSTLAGAAVTMLCLRERLFVSPHRHGK